MNDAANNESRRRRVRNFRVLLTERLAGALDAVRAQAGNVLEDREVDFADLLRVSDELAELADIAAQLAPPKRPALRLVK